LFSKVDTFYLKGVRGMSVEVETDISRGIPDFKIIGLCGVGIHESAKRVRTAVLNSGISFPKGRVTVNLSPADIKKDGSGFDLPIALGILNASGVIPKDKLSGIAVLGELSLDGSVKSVRGVLSMMIGVDLSKVRGVIVPKDNLQEVCCLGIPALGVSSLKATVEILLKSDSFICGNKEFAYGENPEKQYDFNDVFGQRDVKRAIEIAVSGRHNILFMGSRGSGKTMLAKCISGIMPEMNIDEALETASVYSAAGLFMRGTQNITSVRPFREIYTGISQTALIGGKDSGIGEINLAHNGVLYIDEITEMKPNLIDSLRLPLENRYSIFTKDGTSEKIPADFLFVATANPCRCGNLFEGAGKCTCSRVQVRSRITKISSPIADRIDMHIPVRSVKFSDFGKSKEESSSDIAERVKRTVEIQHNRYKTSCSGYNGRADRHLIEKFCRLRPPVKKMLESAVDDIGFSVRGVEKVIRIARTIADMDLREEINTYDISEALQYRLLDRKEFC